MVLKRIAVLGAILLIGLFLFGGRGINTWPITNSEPRGSRIIAFGDSLTQMPRELALKTYPAFLSEMIGKEVVNEGVPGNTTEGALRRLEQDVLNRDPRIVIVLLGGNDYLQRRPMSETMDNLRRIITRIQASGALVVLVGIEAPALLGGGGRAEFRELARETGSVLVPDVLDGILSDPTLRFDNIHPNEKGSKLMAERIEKVAGEYLRR